MNCLQKCRCKVIAKKMKETPSRISLRINAPASKERLANLEYMQIVAKLGPKVAL